VTHFKEVINVGKEYDIQLTPSPNGENCIGNGQNKDVECMCDECDYFLECYPEWDRKK